MNVNIPTAFSGANPDQDLLDASASLAQTLFLRSSETEQLGKLPEETIADLRNAGLFDIVVPSIYGGRQGSLRTYMDIVVNLAKGDGAVAWTHTLLTGSTWLTAALFPKHVTDQFFASGKNVLAAGALMPQKAKTRAVSGGIIIEEGLWGFNSGVYHAQWDLLGVPVFNEAGEMIDRAFALIPISEVKLLHDWDTIGLRGTGSTGVTVTDVFVPHERLALASKALHEDYRSNHLRDEPLYRLAIVPLLVTKLVWPILGMAKAVLGLVIEGTAKRNIAFTLYERQSDAAVTHLQLGEASAKIDAAETMIKNSIDALESYAASGNTMPTEMRARIWRDAGFAARQLWEAVDLLSASSGGASARSTNPISRYWRDARVASLHGGLCANTTFEAFGRILCGKEPNSPMLR